MMRVFFSLTQSRIEGIEPMAARYNLLVSTVKKKSYDVLDSRRSEFDVDYEEFKRGFSEVEVGFMTSWLHECSGSRFHSFFTRNPVQGC